MGPKTLLGLEVDVKYAFWSGPCSPCSGVSKKSFPWILGNAELSGKSARLKKSTSGLRSPYAEGSTLEAPYRRYAVMSQPVKKMP